MYHQIHNNRIMYSAYAEQYIELFLLTIILDSLI